MADDALEMYADAECQTPITSIIFNARAGIKKHVTVYMKNRWKHKEFFNLTWDLVPERPDAKIETSPKEIKPESAAPVTITWRPDFTLEQGLSMRLTWDGTVQINPIENGGNL